MDYAKKSPISAMSFQRAEELGRVRLSRHFWMREFLHSEIATVYGMANYPDDPELAIAAGRQLCENILEPLHETFGGISIRSGYRSPEVNGYGNVHDLNCASNERDRARHIWDQRDAAGNMGAMATIIVPWLLDNRHNTRSWEAMAWWIHDHLPYSDMIFHAKLTAFNVSWREQPERRIHSYVAPRGVLTKPGMPNFSGDHSSLYPGFPEFKEARHLADFEAMRANTN